MEVKESDCLLFTGDESLSDNNSNLEPHKTLQSKEHERTEIFKQILSALFFGISSFAITIINKSVLTSYNFPSFLFLSFGQLTASIVVLGICRYLKLITYPFLQRNTFRKIFPLPFLFLGNMMFGLAGTQALSLPMFAALRRCSILFTMLLEMIILDTQPSVAVKLSVYGMIAGAFLAASDDLSFHITGYTFAMITNALNAAYGVFMKQKLDRSDFGKYGLMFYNSLFMYIPALAINYHTGDFHLALDFKGWRDPVFVALFVLSCLMGVILTFSTILCTELNSALTTAIVGSLKNVCVTYVGIFIGGDYIFSWLNCIGLNISVAANILYTYVTFQRKQTVDKNPLLPTTTDKSGVEQTI